MQAGNWAWVLLAAGLVSGCGSDVQAAQADAQSTVEQAPTLDFPPVRARSGAPQSQAVEPNSGADAPARSRGAAARLGDDLERKVEGLVASALQAGVEASKGKLNPDEVVVSVVLRDVVTGDVLLDRMGGTPLAPASNMKIITVAAALLGLGVDATFETSFELHGDVEAGVLEGDLVVRAGGDPLHVREGDGSLDRWMDPLAASLRAKGIERLAGQLVLDEGKFEAPGPAPQWPSADQYWAYYCALSGGFSANGGVFRATVTTDGGNARVVLRPRHHGLDRKGSVSIAGKRSKLRVGANSEAVTVGGSVPAGTGPYVEEFSHPDPVALFGYSVLGGLQARGVEVADFDRRSVEARGPVVHVIRTPITSVVEAILLDSNNAVADQLFYRIGHGLRGAGTREASAAAVREILGRFGVDVAALEQFDGSGLSKADRATARIFVAALNAVMGDPEASGAFVKGLPVAGQSGSLRNRMKGTVAEGRVWAKTGWVSGASSLSGTIKDADGDSRVTFSIVVSYPRLGGLNSTAWKPMQDQICELIAERLDAAAPAGSGR